MAHFYQFISYLQMTHQGLAITRGALRTRLFSMILGDFNGDIWCFLWDFLWGFDGISSDLLRYTMGYPLGKRLQFATENGP